MLSSSGPTLTTHVSSETGAPGPGGVSHYRAAARSGGQAAPSAPRLGPPPLHSSAFQQRGTGQPRPPRLLKRTSPHPAVRPPEASGRPAMLLRRPAALHPPRSSSGSGSERGRSTRASQPPSPPPAPRAHSPSPAATWRPRASPTSRSHVRATAAGQGLAQMRSGHRRPGGAKL